MACKHEWQAVSVFGSGFINITPKVVLVCLKCMTYTEKEIKFVLSEKEE